MTLYAMPSTANQTSLELGEVERSGMKSNKARAVLIETRAENSEWTSTKKSYFGRLNIQIAWLRFIGGAWIDLCC